MSDYTQDRTEMTFDDIHFEDVQQDLAELSSERVLESGLYVGSVTELTLFTKPSEGDRQYAELKTQLFDTEGKKLRKVRVNVSWEKRIRNGRIDKPFRLFSQLRNAMEVKSFNPAEVVMAAKEGTFKVNVNECYLVHESDLHESHVGRKSNDEGEVWVGIPAGDEAQEVRMHYLSSGYEAISLVQGIYKA